MATKKGRPSNASSTAVCIGVGMGAPQHRRPPAARPQQPPRSASTPELHREAITGQQALWFRSGWPEFATSFNETPLVSRGLDDRKQPWTYRLGHKHLRRTDFVPRQREAHLSQETAPFSPAWAHRPHTASSVGGATRKAERDPTTVRWASSQLPSQPGAVAAALLSGDDDESSSVRNTRPRRTAPQLQILDLVHNRMVRTPSSPDLDHHHRTLSASEYTTSPDLQQRSGSVTVDDLKRAWLSERPPPPAPHRAAPTSTRIRGHEPSVAHQGSDGTTRRPPLTPQRPTKRAALAAEKRKEALVVGKARHALAVEILASAAMGVPQGLPFSNFKPEQQRPFSPMRRPASAALDGGARLDNTAHLHAATKGARRSSDDPFLKEVDAFKVAAFGLDAGTPQLRR